MYMCIIDPRVRKRTKVNIIFKEMKTLFIFMINHLLAVNDKN